MRKLSEYACTLSAVLLFFAQYPCRADSRSPLESDLSAQEANWNVVLSGAAVCAPQLTSYGFAVLTDGRMISACTDSGTVLWQRAVPGKPDPFLTVLGGDFLLTVNDGQTLSLTNPGGLTLWSVPVPFQILSAPYEGRDGRIFVRGSTNIACFSIKGICKWTLETAAQSTLPVSELPDGSIVAFLAQPSGGKTEGLRVSPFGDILEQITFAGIVTSAESCGSGILLTFADGNAGMCAIPGGEVRSVWAAASAGGTGTADTGKDKTFFLDSGTGSAALVRPLAGNAHITVYNTADGTAVSSVTIADLSMNSPSYVSADKNGFILADDNRAVCITRSGEIQWSAVLPQKNGSGQPWNYLTVTPDGYLIVCRMSWAAAGYRMSQELQNNGSPAAADTHPGYRAFLNTDAGESVLSEIRNLTGSLESGLTDGTRSSALSRGMYGNAEQKWTQELLGAAGDYLVYLRSSNTGGRTDSVFSNDITGTDSMLRQLPQYGTDTFPPLIAKLITYERNRTHMRTLLETAAVCAYDPDGSLLDSLDTALFSIQPDDDALLTALCDAVYAVCRFMGRPAFYRHGRDILSRLLYPQYGSRVRAYARTTLTNIVRLKL